MKSSARVVVIGGGIAGVSVLYHLAKLGETDTLLLEREELTSGSTWHAAGHVPTYAASWGLMRAQNYAWRLYQDLAAEVGYPIDYHLTGAIWPAHGQKRMDLFAHLVGISRGLGLDLRLLSVAEMAVLHPYLETHGLIGGIHDPYEGDIDPSQATQALAKGARDLGAEISRFNPCLGIAQKPSGEWLVQSAQGDVVCEAVVNAGGYRGAEVAGFAGEELPIVTLEHQYLVTEEIPELAARAEKIPLLRDPEDSYYLRQERGGLLLGPYEFTARPVWEEGIPPDFGMELFADALEDAEPFIEKACARVPPLATAGVQRVINGPVPYTPDGLALVGPAYGLRNFYHCCGLQVGITHGPAAGKTIAEMILQGESEWDMWAWDPRRLLDHNTPAYARARACEMFENQYHIPFPHRRWTSGRKAKVTPLYETLARKGAVFDAIGGWERAMYFDSRGVAEAAPLSFHRDEPLQACVQAECLSVRDHVGVMDHGGMARFMVEGPAAEGFLNHVFCSRLPPQGRVALGYFLTAKGRVYSEATISRLAEDRFMLCGPTLGRRHDFDWLERHRPADGVVLSDLTDTHNVLMLQGPKSRELLARVTGADLSPEAFPWFGVRQIDIAGVSAWALRVSYVGELGWELHLPIDSTDLVYAELFSAGGDLGLRDFGSYALNAMRLEKGYHGWRSEFGPEYSPFEAGIDRFIDFGKGDFIGREGALAARAAPRAWHPVALRVAAGDADARADSPIMTPAGEVCGFVTSGGYGWRTGASLALGFVTPGHDAEGTELRVEILGETCGAVVSKTPFYDSENARLKS